MKTKIPKELEGQFAAKLLGKTVDEYVQQLIVEDLKKPRPIAEILAPFREEVEKSGITDDELDAMVEEIREEIYQEKLAKEREQN